MTYIEKFQNDLFEKLKSDSTMDSIVRWTCEQLVQSYKNGLAAGQKGATAKSRWKNPKRGSSSQAQ